MRHWKCNHSILMVDRQDFPWARIGRASVTGIVFAMVDITVVYTLSMDDL